MLLLDDDPARLEAAANALAEAGLPFTIEPARSVAELEARLAGGGPPPWLVSLDHDLGAPRVVAVGQVADPGTGLGAARALVTLGFAGPVLVHTSAEPAAQAIGEQLEAGGLSWRRAALTDAGAWAEAVAACWRR